MQKLTREKARAFFKESGLKYDDLSKENIQILRSLINDKMKKSGLIKKSFRCKQRGFICYDGLNRLYAGIRCRSFYFDDREAVSFNPDGFIGFAGWADETNIKPIIEGFVEWVIEIKKLS